MTTQHTDMNPNPGNPLHGMERLTSDYYVPNVPDEFIKHSAKESTMSRLNLKT